MALCMDKWNITISWFIFSSRGCLECWQLTWMADGSQTQRAEVYTRSHSEARTRQMIHRNLVHSWHCTMSGIAMCREDVYSVLPIWRFDKRRFGDSQFFWNCHHHHTPHVRAVTNPSERWRVLLDKSDLEFRWGRSFKHICQMKLI